MTASTALNQRLEERRAWMGASDIAAILGLSQWRNAADIYWQKVAELDGADNAATMRGRYVEPAILSWFEAEIKQPIERDVRVACAEHPLIVSQLDGQLPDGTPVEAKSAASDRDAEGNVVWGDEYTDQIPEDYIVQGQTQMLCTGADICHVPALIAGFRSLEFRRYIIPRSEPVIEAIVEVTDDFWERYIKTRTPPTGCVPSIETIKRIRREPETIVSLDDEALALRTEYERLGKLKTGIEGDRDLVQAKLLAMLGTAEAGELPDGRLLTYLEENSQRRCDFDLFRALNEPLYTQLVSQGRHRTMRVKKPKAARKAA